MAMMRSTLIVSGAFGIFRKDIAMACGGYRAASITEDLDLVVRMQKLMHEQKKPYRIHFIPDPICWTEAPGKPQGPGPAEEPVAPGPHRDPGPVPAACSSTRATGSPGMFAMPFYAVFEMAGPFIEVLGYGLFVSHILLGQVDYPFAVTFFFVAVFYGTFVSLLAILLEELSAHRYPASATS